MVLDSLAVCGRYLHLHPSLARAFQFASGAELPSLPPGRHAIDGEELYVSVDHMEGRGRTGARLEAHRRYIDVQLTLEGTDEIGWRPLSSCTAPAGPFDEGRDVRFYEDQPESWMSISRGRFAIFFPADAHAPFAGRGLIRKAVIKIRL